MYVQEIAKSSYLHYKWEKEKTMCSKHILEMNIFCNSVLISELGHMI